MKKGLFWCTNHHGDEPSLIIKAIECDINGMALVDGVSYSSKSGENFNHKQEWKGYDKSITKGIKIVIDGSKHYEYEM